MPIPVRQQPCRDDESLVFTHLDSRWSSSEGRAVQGAGSRRGTPKRTALRVQTPDAPGENCIIAQHREECKLVSVSVGACRDATASESSRAFSRGSSARFDCGGPIFDWLSGSGRSPGSVF